MSGSLQQITRREVLKRGAIAGGTVLWVAPVVQTLGMSRAFANTPSDHCLASWATAAVAAQSWQGLQLDGVSAVLSERSNMTNALGPPSNPAPGEEPYYTLGFAGYLVLELGIPYYVGRGGTSLTIETTVGSYPEEKASVEVAESATGPWWPIGTATNLNSPALTKYLDTAGLPGSLIVSHVKITDTSDKSKFTEAKYSNADGFDLNACGITCDGVAP